MLEWRLRVGARERQTSRSSCACGGRDEHGLLLGLMWGREVLLDSNSDWGRVGGLTRVCLASLEVHVGVYRWDMPTDSRVVGWIRARCLCPLGLLGELRSRAVCGLTGVRMFPFRQSLQGRRRKQGR